MRRRRHGGSIVPVVEAGVAAGVLAGGAMLAFVTIVSGWRGLGWFAPVRAFAGLFLGVRALEGGWGTALLGLCVHGAVAASLGVLFTAIALRRTDPLESVGTGVGLATIAWAVLTYGVGRVTNEALMQVVRAAPFAWFGGHIVFGIVVASARQLFDVALASRAVASGDGARGTATQDLPEAWAAGADVSSAEPSHAAARPRAMRALRVAARAAAGLGVAWLAAALTRRARRSEG